MGADCHVRIVGADDLVWAQDEVRRLEALWTRFADSELTSLNTSAREVDPDTRLLVERAVQGFDLTGGLFNPFLTDQIEAAGYDRDFDEIEMAPVRGASPGVRPTVTIDGDRVASSLPVDSGGIGKGLAADLVSTRLLQRGALGALVNLGGDLRCVGQSPGDRWNITIETPVPVAEQLAIKLTDGAVCTSTPLLRRWRREDGEQMHHLLDPRTGVPMRTSVGSVSVIARQAWLAEVLTKALLLMPADQAVPLLREHEAAALVVSADGTVEQL